MAVPFGITIKGLDEAVKRFESVRIKRVIDENIKRITLEIKGEIRNAAPTDTGKFRRSISHKFADDGQTASIYTNVFYGRFLEYGTGSYYQPPAGIFERAPRFNPGWTKAIPPQSNRGIGIGSFAYGQQQFNAGQAEKKLAGDIEQELGEP